MADFSSYAHRVARKEHECSLCGGTIKSGEVYVRQHGVYCGRFFDTKYHLLCERAITLYCKDLEVSEYDHDSVIDWMDEIVCCDCEHGWHDDGKDDCSTSIFECKRAINRIMEVDSDG